MAEVMPMQIRARGNAFATGIGNWLVSPPTPSPTPFPTSLTNPGLHLLGTSLTNRARSTDLEVLLPLRGLEHCRHVPDRLLLFQGDETG